MSNLNLTTKPSSKELLEKSYQIRRHILESTTNAGSGHPGGSLSCVDILTVLYFNVMNHDPKNPSWPERDRFILSKGHAAPALYATLAETGYIPIKSLKTLRKTGSFLQGHPDKNRLPCIENSSGSLGNGLAIANGIALSGKLDEKKYQVFVMLGDGECDEGLVWEAAMFASNNKIDNLTAIVDRNGLQIDGPTESIMSLEPFSDKWKSFGWHVIQVDGNDIHSIINAFDEAKKIKNKPTVIIAYLVKGKGVSIMEWVGDFHGMALSKEQCKKSLKELDKWHETMLG